ncbi:MAG: uroporphyrinogen decarboxylase family protein [Desulfobacterales bacterium]
MTNPELDVAHIIELLEVDRDILEKGRKRQEAVWKGQEPDYLPILMGGLKVSPPFKEIDPFFRKHVLFAEHWLELGVDIPEARKNPEYNYREMYLSKEKMLEGYLWELIAISRSRSDSQLSIRPNHGLGFIGGIFGLGIGVPEDNAPWITGRLSKEEINNFDVPDLRKVTIVSQMIEFTRYFQDKLKDKVPVFLPSTLGPFLIAHAVRGADIFTDMYDDPEFVHRLMEMSTRVYIEITKLFKEVIGEELTSGYHGTLYMAQGGVRLCDCDSTLLSPELFAEFSLPYLKRALEPFGGGWLHICGHGNHLLDMYLDVPGIKGINFGNPESWDYEKVMPRIIEKGKFYYGGFCRQKGENLRDYFERIVKPLEGSKRGLIFIPRGENIYQEDPEACMELWHSLQR